MTVRGYSTLIRDLSAREVAGRHWMEEIMRQLTLTVGAILALACGAFAQSTTGAIVGVVTDPTSAAVPGARLVAVEELTNVQSETTTDPQGNYAFPNLRPGTYRIEVEAAGFRRLVRSGIEVRVNDRLRVDLSLVLGAITESVEVAGVAPLVESESGAIGTVIDNKRILNIPLNTRNPFQLALLSPASFRAPPLATLSIPQPTSSSTATAATSAK